MAEVKDELERIIPLLNTNPKAKEVMDGWPRLIRFELEGEEQPFSLVVEQGQAKLLDDPASREPDIILLGSAKEFVRVVRRERDITHPIAEGTVWLGTGKLSQMIIFDRILAMSKRRK